MEENKKELNPIDEYRLSIDDNESFTIEDIKSLGFIEIEENHYRTYYNNEVLDLVQTYNNGEYYRSHLSILDDKGALKSGISGVITSKQELLHLMDNLEKMTTWLVENHPVTEDDDVIVVGKD